MPHAPRAAPPPAQLMAFATSWAAAKVGASSSARRASWDCGPAVLLDTLEGVKGGTELSHYLRGMGGTFLPPPTPPPRRTPASSTMALRLTCWFPSSTEPLVSFTSCWVVSCTRLVPFPLTGLPKGFSLVCEGPAGPVRSPRGAARRSSVPWPGYPTGVPRVPRSRVPQALLGFPGLAFLGSRRGRYYSYSSSASSSSTGGSPASFTSSSGSQYPEA